ncbi:MAG: thioredoxin [Flavobacteriales bacterium]|nr:thioredoxin [Flavobacteriales bacterium]
MAKYSQFINSDKPTLIDFYADWCAPCKTMAPILAKVQSQMGNRITLIKVNTDKSKAIAADYKIRSIPTLILFKRGKEIWRKTGVVPAKVITGIIEKQLK